MSARPSTRPGAGRPLVDPVCRVWELDAAITQALRALAACSCEDGGSVPAFSRLAQAQLRWSPTARLGCQLRRARRRLRAVSDGALLLGDLALDELSPWWARRHRRRCP